MDNSIDLALTAAGESARDPHSVEETLATIVESAKLSLPGFDHIGISTLDIQGVPTTRAATSELVWKLDDLQYKLWKAHASTPSRTLR